jgi:multiple sugar transport system substrate-binding protein
MPRKTLIVKDHPVKEQIGSHLARVTLCLSVAVLLAAGCRREQRTDAPAPEPDQPTPSVTLRVLVVNDLPLTEAINRLRGEWSVRSGGQLEATSASWQEAESAGQVDADVIVFPARHLGTLCERGWLRPIRGSVMQGTAYDADDVLPLVRQRLIRYGGKDMALPLGVELPLVGYRQNWLAERHDGPPRSWGEFDELVRQPGVTLLWWPRRGSVEHWEATMLLARAAAYAVHPSREGVLFDPHLMEPRIAEPPFVRALEEWRRELHDGVAGVERSDPPATLGGPQPPRAALGAAGESEAVVWAELPGSDALYNHPTGQWETAEEGVRQVPLLGGGGKLAGVTGASRNAASAFQFAVWLTGSEIGGQIGPKAAASLPCRRSQLRLAGQWLSGPPLPLGEGWSEGVLSNHANVAQAVERALGGDACLVVPPLPGIDDYLAALDDGVKQAFRGESSSADALGQVARRWEDITDARGREAQRRAYLNHLGIVDP